MQLAITINFISSKDDNDEKHAMHSNGDKITEIMISEEADKVTEELSDSLKNRYQNKLETEMTNSEFVFDYAHLLY